MLRKRGSSICYGYAVVLVILALLMRPFNTSASSSTATSNPPPNVIARYVEGGNPPYYQWVLLPKSHHKVCSYTVCGDINSFLPSAQPGQYGIPPIIYWFQKVSGSERIAQETIIYELGPFKATFIYNHMGVRATSPRGFCLVKKDKLVPASSARSCVGQLLVMNIKSFTAEVVDSSFAA